MLMKNTTKDPKTEAFFPERLGQASKGISIRDYMALNIMSGLAPDCVFRTWKQTSMNDPGMESESDHNRRIESRVALAYHIADEMLKQRNLSNDESGN